MVIVVWRTVLTSAESDFKLTKKIPFDILNILIASDTDDIKKDVWL